MGSKKPEMFFLVLDQLKTNLMKMPTLLSLIVFIFAIE